jgi:hypothetical protein
MQGMKLRWVALFAAGMAYVEAAAVVYLRGVLGVTDLIRDVAPFDPHIARLELGRELATLIMIATLGWAVGRSTQARWGFAFFTFGLWDILYYAWLKVFLDWPHSLMEPDLLFLIPLPWWGPVLTPVLIALLAVVGGVLAFRCVRARPIGLCSWPARSPPCMPSWRMPSRRCLPHPRSWAASSPRRLPGPSTESVSR